MSDNKKDNRVVLESINWREALPFTQLFRTFRLAIHPSKLGLALVAVLICYIGGRFLDLVAGRQVVVERPFYTMHMPADEIEKYMSSPTMAKFRQWREQAKARNNQIMIAALMDHIKEPQKAKEMVKGEEAFVNLAAALEMNLSKSLKILHSRYEQTQQLIQKEFDQNQKTVKGKEGLAEDRAKSLAQLKQARDYLEISMRRSTQVAKEVLEYDSPAQAVDIVIRVGASDQLRDAGDIAKDREQIQKTIQMADTYYKIENSQGLGIFQAALSYGILMFNSAVDSVLAFELFKNPAFISFGTTPNIPPGLVNTLGLAIKGLGWFVQVHWLYFIIYFLFCLGVWSIAGGAICRIAALHATRDEKIPLSESCTFALRKFGSFFSAPLMPVLFIIGCCIPLLAAGLFGAIPVLGELVVGITFIIILLISFALAITIIGAVGGMGMMYPTIAVEGSDTFDAFSRSYSYVYARPWRTIFYTLVTAIYGTLCFIFVKILISLVFKVAAAITGATMNIDHASMASPLGKLEAIWFSPGFFAPFFGRFYLFPLNWSESLASFFVALWVFLFVGLVIAFAISFFFCGYTIIYLLLRRCVDATELDEVYVEDFEKPLPESMTPAPAQPAAAASAETSAPETGTTAAPAAPSQEQEPPKEPNS